MEVLDLTTLRQSVSDVETVATATNKLAASLVPRELPMDISYTAPDGKTYKATIINKILGGTDRIKVGRLAAKLLQTPWEEAAPSVRDFCWAYAWLTMSLVDPPEWFNKWVSDDEVLLFSVFSEVLGHEDRYFQGNDNSRDAAEKKSRISIASAVSTIPPNM